MENYPAYSILADTVTATGNKFVWFTDEGWFFNEQPNSKMFTQEQVLNAESFEQLFSAPVVEPEDAGGQEETKKVTRKKGK